MQKVRPLSAVYRISVTIFSGGYHTLICCSFRRRFDFFFFELQQIEFSFCFSTQEDVSGRTCKHFEEVGDFGEKKKRFIQRLCIKHLSITNSNERL